MNLLFLIFPFPQILVSKPWIRNEIPRTKLNPLSDLGRASLEFLIDEFQKDEYFQNFATSGNRTRASRVAGENSTTEPTLHVYPTKNLIV